MGENETKKQIERFAVNNDSAATRRVTNRKLIKRPRAEQCAPGLSGSLGPRED